jgi:hypothetical protein
LETACGTIPLEAELSEQCLHVADVYSMATVSHQLLNL